MAGAIHSLSLLLLVVAVSMLATALVGLGMGESVAAAPFFTTAMATGFVAGSIYFASRRRAEARSRRGRYLFLVLAWVIPPIFAAIPLLPATDGDFFASLFEAVSGLTTTGASVFAEIDALSRTDVLWRAELHWLGGFLTLVLVIVALAPAGVGGIPARDSVVARRAVSGEGAPQWGLIRDLLIGYSVTTAVVIGALAAAGIPSFDAVCLAMASVSTGGFMPSDGGLGAYASPLGELILALAMIAGATSVLWHRMLVGGRWQALRDHRESYWIIAAAFFVGLAAAIALVDDFGIGWGEALRLGFVNGASLVSTSGMEVQAGGFGLLPVAFVLLVAMIGGGAFSTAGGLRFFRLGGMLIESLKETRRLIYPHGVRPKVFGSREFDVGVIKAIWSLVTASIAVLAIAALGMALSGVEFGGAAAAAVAMLSNVGGVYTAEWAEAASWPTFAEMPIGVQLLLMAVMIVGRLEVIAVVVAVSLVIWRS